MAKYYFLENKEWYYRSKNGKYVLLPKAPPQVKESYEQYLKDSEVKDITDGISNDLADIRNKYRSIANASKG